MIESSEIDYARCLVFLKPTSEWSISANDYSTLIWHTKDAKPTEQEIIACWSEAKAAYEAKISGKVAKKQEILDRLGVTFDEIYLLLR